MPELTLSFTVTGEEAQMLRFWAAAECRTPNDAAHWALRKVLSEKSGYRDEFWLKLEQDIRNDAGRDAQDKE